MKSKWLIFINMLCCSVIFCQWHSAGSKMPCKMKIERKLLAMGATQLHSDSFLIEKGMVLSLSYQFDHLSTASIRLEPEYTEGNSFQGFQDEDRPCCMSIPTYKRLVAFINGLQQLGGFVRNDPIGIIPTSGWIRRREEYKDAFIVVSERNCSNPDPRYGCGIDGFAVYYWLQLSGKVESKEIRTISFGEPPLMEYIVKVSGKEFRVSKVDYDRLRKGIRASLKVTVEENWAEIILIK